MNRRGFIGTISGFLATAALDPKKLPWIPGKKTISVPSGITMVDRGLIIGVAKHDIAAGEYGSVQIYGMIDVLTDGTISRWDGTRFDGPKLSRRIKAEKPLTAGSFVYNSDVSDETCAPTWYNPESQVYGAQPVFRNSHAKTS